MCKFIWFFMMENEDRNTNEAGRETKYPDKWGCEIPISKDPDKWVSR